MAEGKDMTEGQGHQTAPAGAPARALDHVGISVPDIAAAVAWYRDILGCYVLMEPIEGYADDSYFGQIVADIFGADFKGMKIAHLATADGVGIELFQFVANAAAGRTFRLLEDRHLPHLQFWIPISKAWPSGSTRAEGASAARCGNSGRTSLTRSAIARIRGAPSSRSAPTPTS